MDFIALVSSEGHTWPGVVSLDSLRAPYSDSGALLLKHIVKSQRESPPKVTIGTEAEHQGDGHENPDFAIPTGAVGAQAVYSIIENYIRNSAKYGTAPIEAPLEVSMTIGASVAWPDHWECLLKDNNRSVIESALRVVTNFDRPIFDHRDPSQSHRNWGLKEIKIAALFLAGGAEAVRGQYDPDRPGYAGPQAEWVLADELDGECSLQLRFHLMRPLGICLLGSSAVIFAPAPLMHVFDTPAAMFLETASSQRRYELLVVDREAIDRLGSERSMSALFQRAMRIAFVGAPPDDDRIAADPDMLSLAPDWAALAAMASATDMPPWHAIGHAWVNRRWPRTTTVFASKRPDAEPEIVALVDRVVPEFPDMPPPEEVEGWLVWDHSRHPDTDSADDPVYERFAFHRPVSHPVRVGLAPDDGPWRLKEAACLQIGIIDERIWGSRDKVAKDQGYKKVPVHASSLFDAWRRAGVSILDAALVGQWFRRAAEQPHLLCAGRAENSGRAKPFDFLVVHRSLIDQTASIEVERDQISARTGPDVRDVYVREIMAWLRQATHKLVITSGRGLEPSYHKVLEATGAGFVEFSALADALIDNTGDKVGLVKLLRSV
ncbi:MAG TPA: hypothetical protein VFT23_06460 [Burkholderiales bacterium]|nr:hypothetical protein [Burkholderiales bacterium]